MRTIMWAEDVLDIREKQSLERALRSMSREFELSALGPSHAPSSLARHLGDLGNFHKDSSGFLGWSSCPGCYHRWR